MNRHTNNTEGMIIIFSVVLILSILAWSPWINDKEIHNKLLREKAHIDGTFGRVIYPDGTEKYELICDYKIEWAPFDRIAISCEGMYYINTLGYIIPNP